MFTDSLAARTARGSDDTSAAAGACAAASSASKAMPAMALAATKAVADMAVTMCRPPGSECSDSSCAASCIPMPHDNSPHSAACAMAGGAGSSGGGGGCAMGRPEADAPVLARPAGGDGFSSAEQLASRMSPATAAWQELCRARSAAPNAPPAACSPTDHE